MGDYILIFRRLFLHNKNTPEKFNTYFSGALIYLFNITT